MSVKSFFDNFAVLADAPNSVTKLRELVLQLAVRGQLGTQDPHDELASELFRKIQLHKVRLVKDKLIRDSKPLPAIQQGERLFDIPQSWQWVRLGDIGDWGAGATPDRKNSKYYGGDIRWFKSGELNDGYICESEETITDLALKECSLRLNQPDDVLIAMYGATIGRLAILQTEATTNQAVCACTCFDGLYNRFLFVLLRAYRNHFIGRGAGGAQPNISREKIIHTVAPLPPFEEQKRIVVRVDEMMRLCDELEDRRQAGRDSRLRLNNAALKELNKTAFLAQIDFEQATNRLAANFATLYESAETVDKLRSTILQLAVEGKLVLQDPNDEPASSALAKIHKEREASEEKRQKRMQVFPIDQEVTPFPVPLTWGWTRLGQLAKLIEYGTSEKASGLQTGVPVFRMNNIQSGRIVHSNLKYVSPTIKDLPRLYLKHNELLFNRTNSFELVGKTGIFKGGSDESTFASYLIRIRLFDSHVSPDYVNLAMNADYFRHTQINTQVTQQCGQANFNGTKLANALIPLPPLEEQHRIVKRVTQLMGLCDELEVKLLQAEADREKLMNAAVRHVLAAITPGQRDLFR